MENQYPKKLSRNSIIIVSAIIAVVALVAVIWSRSESASPDKKAESAHGDEHKEGERNEVELSPEAMEAAGIEIITVSGQRVASALRVTGSVEVNQQQTQQVTPLVSGRVERVNVALGDVVRAGQTLAIIASPEVAEMRGKLHEAETRLALAEQNYQRVQRAENRASVIQSKARLEEAEATLRRTQKLIETGAGAGKDLVAAEAAYKSAKAEYDYQSNISVNRDVQQARAEVETSKVEAMHLRNSLRALGVNVPENESASGDHNTPSIALTAPISGSITERLVNAGAGIQSGSPMFTVSNLSTVWVIANVPESQVSRLRVGLPAEVRASALGSQSLAGRITYINPLLNEETRTALVRVEIKNPAQRLKIGMFVEVAFETGDESATDEKEIVVPEDAVQRIGDRAIVFIPKENETGHFEAREVEPGGTVDGLRKIISGLKAGERVVTKGSFTLKTQLMKGEMGDAH
ncbi:MAG: efflux RND transporter periplasmic adaptor subunit [Acidobacteriota bacterium]